LFFSEALLFSFEIGMEFSIRRFYSKAANEVKNIKKIARIRLIIRSSEYCRMKEDIFFNLSCLSRDDCFFEIDI